MEFTHGLFVNTFCMCKLERDFLNLNRDFFKFVRRGFTTTLDFHIYYIPKDILKSVPIEFITDNTQEPRALVASAVDWVCAG